MASKKETVTNKNGLVIFAFPFEGVSYKVGQVVAFDEAIAGQLVKAGNLDTAEGAVNAALASGAKLLIHADLVESVAADAVEATNRGESE